MLVGSNLVLRGTKFNANTVKYYAKAAKHGSKHVYLALPRILTIWLWAGVHPGYKDTKQFYTVQDLVAQAILSIPTYKASAYRIANPRKLTLKLVLGLVVHSISADRFPCGTQQPPRIYSA